MFRIFWLAACAAMLSIAAPSYAETVAERVRVIDGDSIDFGNRIVHLFGIEAPMLGVACTLDERTVDCGVLAMNRLFEIIGGQLVRCEVVRSGDGTELGHNCISGGRDIAEIMVTDGWAKARRSDTDEYVYFEALAWVNRRGLWGSAGYRERN